VAGLAEFTGGTTISPAAMSLARNIFRETLVCNRDLNIYIKLYKVCKVTPSLDLLISSLEAPPTPSAYICIIAVFDFCWFLRTISHVLRMKLEQCFKIARC
jgi:hypothetical protein